MSKIEKPAVLVADDNVPTRTLITALLQKDFTVDEAGDGAEAIEKLRTKSYAAVLLDLLMPGMDGYAVLEFLQTHDPGMLRRVLVVTAALTRKDRARTQQYRVFNAISKPFDVDALLGAVRECAGESPSSLGSLLSSGMIFLLADLLQHRWM